MPLNGNIFEVTHIEKKEESYIYLLFMIFFHVDARLGIRASVT